jgi:signal peptidase II
MLSKKKTAIILFVLAVFLLAVDRFLKILALHQINEYILIGDVLRFNFAKNYFIAFSLPIGGWPLLSVIFIIMIFLIIYSSRLYRGKKFVEASLVLTIFFGAASNLSDRLQYGYVVDYVDLKYFTVFNIADAMIVTSTIILFLMQLIDNKNNKKISTT